MSDRPFPNPSCGSCTSQGTRTEARARGCLQTRERPSRRLRCTDDSSSRCRAGVPDSRHARSGSNGLPKSSVIKSTRYVGKVKSRASCVVLQRTISMQTRRPEARAPRGHRTSYLRVAPRARRAGALDRRAASREAACCFDPRRHSRFVIIAAEARIANSGGRRSCVRATAARARVPRGPRGVADLAGGRAPARPARVPRTHRACPTRGYGGGVRVTRPACKLEGQPDAGAIARIRRDPDGRARDRGRRGRPRGGDRDRSRRGDMRGDRGDGGPREVFQRACFNATGPPDAESAESGEASWSSTDEQLVHEPRAAPTGARTRPTAPPPGARRSLGLTHTTQSRTNHRCPTDSRPCALSPPAPVGAHVTIHTRRMTKRMHAL